MKALLGREFARLIERHGWTLLRTKQSNCAKIGSGT